MQIPRRPLTYAAVLAALVVAAVPAGAIGAGLEERQQHIEDRIAGLRDNIEQAKQKEGVLTGEIQAATDGIGSLEGRIATLSGIVAELQADLDARRARLAALEQKLAEQTERLEYLVGQHAIALQRLEERLVDLYTTETTTTLDIVLQVGSLTDLFEQLDYFEAVGEQDQAITAELETLRDDMRVARAETAATRKEVAQETAVLAEKTAEQREAHQLLVAERSALAAARDQKQGLLANVREERDSHEEDLEAMQAASADIAARIQAAQAAAAEQAPPSTGSGSGGGDSSGGGSPGPPSSSGFIWPCSGTLTSGFGWRWGRMHEGIDIAAPAGTPIRAVANGRIIFAGWMGGYGNMVIIDHGGGIATAYAHMSSIWIGGGSVSQGASIGGVGTTGSSTGNHLHFEVRVNGQAVDPMGYL